MILSAAHSNRHTQQIDEVKQIRIFRRIKTHARQFMTHKNEPAENRLKETAV
jgi:hypothetical protein